MYKRQTLIRHYLQGGDGGTVIHLQKGKSLGITARTHPSPVSYTHLDVYKRQALSITPEMEQAIHTIRTAENANKTDTPEYAEAIDTFNAANGYQLADEGSLSRMLSGMTLPYTRLI